MEFVLRQGRCIGEGLPDIFYLEIGKVGDDLCGGHVVRDEVDDVRHGDSKATNRRAAAQEIRVLRDAVECVCYVSLSVHCSGSRRAE